MSTTEDSKKSSKHNDELYDYLLKLPKVELHAHLNGCIREETLFALAAERGVTLPAAYFHPHNNNSDEDDGLLYNTMPRSLTDCFAMFAEIPAAVNDLAALRRITREALEDFAAHAVVYVELRSTPKRLWRDFRTQEQEEMATKREYIETILQVMEQIEAQEEERYERQVQQQIAAGEDLSLSMPRPPLKCRFLVSVDRSQSEQEAAEHVDLAIALRSNDKNPRVVGMDLGGNPTKQDFRLFCSHFERARASGLRITLHCAEIPCDPQSANNPRAYQEAKAILDFAPHRIGHALLLPPDLQSLLMQRQIPVETCPTSNVMTLELARNHHDGTHLTLLQGLAQHGNLRQWLSPQQHHPLVICTDDPGVFGTDLTKEWWLVAKTFDISRDYFDNLATKSMEFAFCDDATRHAIVERLKKVGFGKD